MTSKTLEHAHNSFAAILVAGLLAHAPAAACQTAPAPPPPQVASARTAFLSNAEAQCSPEDVTDSGPPSRAFDEFYAAAKAKLRFQFVAAPEDADLVLEFHSRCSPDPLGKSLPIAFTVVLYAPKSHVPLWTFTERPKLVLGLQKTRDKEFDVAITSLVDDIQRAQTAAVAIAAPQ